MESNQEQFAFTAFERLFKERRLPQAIRSDNGLPFASPNGLFNLSRLSVWWLRLGISIERIRPGNPRQNGRIGTICHPCLRSDNGFFGAGDGIRTRDINLGNIVVRCKL
jgi:hypothetical protein